MTVTYAGVHVYDECSLVCVDWAHSRRMQVADRERLTCYRGFCEHLSRSSRSYGCRFVKSLSDAPRKAALDVNTTRYGFSIHQRGVLRRIVRYDTYLASAGFCRRCSGSCRARSSVGVRRKKPRGCIYRKRANGSV